MHDYTILFHFRADNASLADDLVGEMQEPVDELMRMFPTIEYGSLHASRGNRIDELVIAESNSIAEESDQIANAGLNDNPLPEGMPTF